MFWIELIGYCGTALTVVAWAMKTSIHLRVAGILSSIAFLLYGYLTASYPVMIMELILLPLNTLRLVEMLRLVRSVEAARSGESADFHLDWLVPHMKRINIAKGATLFRAGDEADTLYVLLSGEITSLAGAQRMRPGAFVGDATLFQTARRQSDTFIASADATVAALPQAALSELYFQNPAFGYQLVQLVVANMRAELDTLKNQPTHGAAFQATAV
ncbi:cyclic nucleotide-binding domain-containing protein [Shinella curvata]|uniref:Cyclic nucleotide-binding domain-containing protein n=1 Tax=Shinella curvata TaxID=1817964 RepID=A0ABT8XA12_9HYPH|nr:cyclic nucleotide-binding domain-containing protein [Shinella curvata]MCJ8055146.1 cyclic nucleotide-binding domain-containing protein [Shinella curvata]MDO6120458.1 cyclic nucleotide-binding domain-containing protein [Shinella curvata]